MENEEVKQEEAEVKQEEKQEKEEEKKEESKTEIAIDYDKIQQMLDGTLKAKEDTALKAYFKQKGLSQEEMETAISEFKAKQKEAKPDIDELTNNLAKAREEIRNSNIKAEALAMYKDLEVDITTIPYLLKMADTKDTTDENGKVDAAKLKEVLKKVVDDIPGLKTQKQEAGFKKVGVEKPKNGNTNINAKNSLDMFKSVFN